MLWRRAWMPWAWLCVLLGCEPRVMVGADCGRCELGEICHPQLQICVQCVDDGPCKQHPTQRLCDPMSHQCVECVDATSCSAATPLCIEGACRPCTAEPSACPDVTGAGTYGTEGDTDPDAGVSEEPVRDAGSGRRRGRR